MPGPITTEAAIAEVQRQLDLNEARITSLDQLGLAIKEDLNSRLPRLRSLAEQIEGNAKFGFELYLPAGDTEIVLYQKGLSGAENWGSGFEGFGEANKIITGDDKENMEDMNDAAEELDRGIRPFDANEDDQPLVEPELQTARFNR